MNILFLTKHNPYFACNATGNRYAGLLDSLQQREAKVTVVVTSGYRNMHEYRAKGKPENRPQLTVIYLVPIFNHTLWMRRINVYLLPRVLDLIVRIRMRHYLSGEFDIVWLTFGTSIFNAFSNNKPRIKSVSFIELNEFNDLYQTDPDRLSNTLQYTKEDRENKAFMSAIGRIDLLGVMTNTLIDHYRPMAKAEARMLHLPMTVDLARFSRCAEPLAHCQKPYIAYTGTLSNKKEGVDILISAFGKLAARYPNVTLYLRGFYCHDVPLQKMLISDLNLDSRVVYLDAMSQPEIVSFLQHAELLALARPESRQATGAFPTKLGEYLATGKPVCVTKVGEIPEYLEDGVSAFVADPGSVESFALAMDHALSDPEAASRIGSAGRKVAEEHFCTDVQGGRLMAFLQHHCATQ